MHPRLEGIGDVPWAQLKHCYGNASDAPFWFAKLISCSEDERADAIGDFLYSYLYHQFGIYSATPFAIQFIIQILSDQQFCKKEGLCAPLKRDLLYFLKCCAELGQKGIHGAPFSQTVTIESEILKGKEVFRLYHDDTDDETRDAARWLLTFSKEQESGA